MIEQDHGKSWEVFGCERFFQDQASAGKSLDLILMQPVSS